MADQWEIGERVVMYRGFSREPSGPFPIEKIYKTGHFVVNGIRFRPSSNSCAHETGSGYSRAMVRKLTPDLEHRIARLRKRDAVLSVAKWAVDLSPDDLRKIDRLPDDALSDLLKAVKDADND